MQITCECLYSCIFQLYIWLSSASFFKKTSVVYPTPSKPNGLPKMSVVFYSDFAWLIGSSLARHMLQHEENIAGVWCFSFLEKVPFFCNMEKSCWHILCVFIAVCHCSVPFFWPEDCYYLMFFGSTGGDD